MISIVDRAPRLRSFRTVLAAAGLMGAALLPAVSTAQVANRLMQLPTSAEGRAVVTGSVSPRVRTAQVLGHLQGETALPGMSLVVTPTAAQQAELTQLLQDQQNPASPQFHKWLTPETYGQRFGLSDADLGLVQSWLTSRGFTVESVAASRNRIVFSGTASAAETAFGTTLQRFHRDDQDYFENSTAITLPSSLANVVAGVTGLSSFHMAPPPHTLAVSPQYTSSSGYHYIVPWDFRQIFGINTLLSQGYDGTGVKIGVIGQSEVSDTQLGYFRQKIGQATNKLQRVLVPSTGTAGQLTAGDEGESELDLEYASGSAPGANVLFIYTGLSRNNGVFDALTYAITSNQAPILTLSYGGCEASNASYATSTLEPVLAQASSQGQTIIVSSGDSGAASCESTSNTTTTATRGLSVSYPASSPNVTSVGGTQLNSGTEPSTSNSYWSSTTDGTTKGSALGYMPETTWNDTAASGSLSSTGGGVSSLFGKPSWQSGTGVPADNRRDLPDVAFPAAVQQHAYIVCTIQQTCLNNTIFGSSTTGVSNGGLIGGTSASAPNFAALLAVVEQATSTTAGLGNINSSLYSLAAGSKANTVFHDITTGNNIVSCSGGSSGCSSTTSGTNGTMGYSAGVGYDLVTGLGSIDAPGLAASLTPATTNPTKLTPTVSVGATNTTSVGGATDLISLTVAGTGATPTGTVTLTFSDGSTSSQTLTLATGRASYTYTVPACTITTASTCTFVITATYGGDAVYNAGSSTISLFVPTTGIVVPASISIAPASPSVTVTTGGSVTNAINVTSTAFAGTVTFTAAANITVGCYSVSPASPTITSGGTTSTTLTLYTSSSACTSSGAIAIGPVAANHAPASPASHVPELAVMAAGLLGAFTLRRRRVAALLTVLVAAMALGISGCGSGSGGTASTNTVSTTPAGTYTVNVTAKGTPSSGATVSATTSFTFVVK